MVATTAYHMSAGMPGWLRRVSSSRGVMGLVRLPDIVVALVGGWWVVVRSRLCDESFRDLSHGPPGGGCFPRLRLCRTDVTVISLFISYVFRQAPRAVGIHSSFAGN